LSSSSLSSLSSSSSSSLPRSFSNGHVVVDDHRHRCHRHRHQRRRRPTAKDDVVDVAIGSVSANGATTLERASGPRAPPSGRPATKCRTRGSEMAKRVIARRLIEGYDLMGNGEVCLRCRAPLMIRGGGGRRRRRWRGGGEGAEGGVVVRRVRRVRRGVR
jgi:hypothetical protein